MSLPSVPDFRDKLCYLIVWSGDYGDVEITAYSTEKLRNEAFERIGKHPTGHIKADVFIDGTAWERP